MMSKNLWFRK